VKVKVEGDRMVIRTFSFAIPFLGLAFVLFPIGATYQYLADEPLIAIFVLIIVAFGIALIGLPSCRATINFASDQIIVSNMIFHVIPIRRRIGISDLKMMYVLRRPFFAGNGNLGPNQIDVEALQLVEKIGRVTNIGHFLGYNRPYQYVMKNGRALKEHSNEDLFGDVIEFLQKNLRAVGRNQIQVGEVHEGVDYFT
jgi:hypothetical protein